MIEELIKVIDTADSKDPMFPPTRIFNEGWILRIFMKIAKENPSFKCSNKKTEMALSHPNNVKFFSEALLSTQFTSRSRKDNLSESRTHADGAIGNFIIEPGKKAGLILDQDPEIFVVIEAKMRSKLSKGITHAPFYDQAARTVSCIANTLKNADKSPSRFKKLAFVLVAPEKRIQDGIFSKLMSKESIRMKVDKRINQYNGEFDNWYQDWFIPTLKQINILEISWEELIVSISEFKSTESIQSFYKKCLKYNF